MVTLVISAILISVRQLAKPNFLLKISLVIIYKEVASIPNNTNKIFKCPNYN